MTTAMMQALQMGRLQVEIKTRDFIASQAMQTLLQRAFQEKLFDGKNYHIQLLAKDAYAIADAMILESAK